MKNIKIPKKKFKNNHNESKHNKKESQDISKPSERETEVKEHTLWWERRGFTQGMPDRGIATYISNKTLDDKFEPSMKMIIKIINSIAKQGAYTKTDLSKDAGLNYTRLVKHVMWMEKKGLVKSKVENSRIKVNLTDKGEKFGSTVADVVE
ncbi:MAG TPA: winged helix-turn-helix domain-containing protein [Nitrososphaeraceae archaeon]|nr:winged helix-turn-helix domain-containing protein [Nitrososphaeraceae archaeon]